MEVARLDSDYIHPDFVKNLGQTAADRDTRVRFIAFTASHLNKQGIACLVAATSPRAATRLDIRKLIDHYIEVFVKCPLEAAQARDVKGLYAMARIGMLPGFTGVGEIYEEPEDPEIIVETHSQSSNEGTAAVLQYLKSKNFISC